MDKKITWQEGGWWYNTGMDAGYTVEMYDEDDRPVYPQEHIVCETKELAEKIAKALNLLEQQEGKEVTA